MSRPQNRNKQNRQKIEAQSEPRQKGEWVAIEERNSKGQPIFPRKAVHSTILTRFDPQKHTDLTLRIITGVAPEGGIIGQYKIYDITKFSMRGWRIEAQAMIELDPTRGYEQAWFEAFEGHNAVICHPGLPGAVSQEYKMKISKSEFSKKIISHAENDSAKKETKVYEGRLWMKETWPSTLLRRKSEAGLYLIVTAIGALIGGVVTSLF